jgi:Tfp pilus assembly protein PilZ
MYVTQSENVKFSYQENGGSVKYLKEVSRIKDGITTKFRSITEAAEKTGFSLNILYAIIVKKLYSHTNDGSMWKYTEDLYKKCTFQNGQYIASYLDENMTELYKIYSSIKEAENSIGTKSLINSIKTGKKHKNFWWAKINNAVQDTQWKQYKNSSYFVSFFGQIKNSRNHILSTRLSNSGYHIVNMTIDGKFGTYLVHRIIAEVYVVNPDNKIFINVDHIDNNKLNNNADNLQWVTPKQNVQKAKSKIVLELDEHNNVINKFSSATELAKIINCSIASISQCCLGKNKTCQGRKFAYEEK